jgi:hypothetical protein
MGTGHATDGTAEQSTQQCTGKATDSTTRRASDKSKTCTNLGSIHGTTRTMRSPANGTNQRTGLATTLQRGEGA